MILSETEARERWCPFVSEAETLDYRGQIDDTGETPVCIASRCMAWRWWNQPANPSQRRGYCGLAGAPGR